jgi:hypothetical protein
MESKNAKAEIEEGKKRLEQFKIDCQMDRYFSHYDGYL